MKKFLLAALTIAASVAIGACGSGAGTTATTAAAPMVAATTGGAADKVPDPTAPEVAVVSIYSINEDGSGLNQELDSIDSLDANLLLKKLIEYKVVGENTTVKDFTDKDGEGVLDLSALAKQDVQTLAAISNTFVENFNLKKLTIKVNGTAVKGGTDLGYIAGYKTYNAKGETSAMTETKAVIVKKGKLNTTATKAASETPSASPDGPGAAATAAAATTAAKAQ